MPPRRTSEGLLNRLDHRLRLAAYLLATLAGYVDANGFLMTGGYFVSFMSGNSTQMAVALGGQAGAAAKAAGLIGAFVAGVMAGAALRRLRPRRPETAVLVLLTVLLLAAAGLASIGLGGPATLVLALAMGAENTVFAEAGEVRVSLTYVTGVLVKCAKGIVAALFGGDRFGWAPQLLLWLSLVSGAVVGAWAFGRFGSACLWGAALAAGLMTLFFRFAVVARDVQQPPPPSPAGAAAP
jgi:uncharacterized membrane protein YoaK (UPF0700 family)